MTEYCKTPCCRLKQAEWKIQKLKEVLNSPEYHKVGRQFYTINDELTKLANRLLAIIN